MLFAPLLTSILNAAFGRREDAYLTEEEIRWVIVVTVRCRNRLQISLGEVTVSTPRDRNVGYSVNVRVSNKWDYL